MLNFLDPRSWSNQQHSDQIPPTSPDLEKAVRKAQFIDDNVDTRDRQTDRLAVTTHNAGDFFGKQTDSHFDYLEVYADQQYAKMLSFNYGDDKYKRLQQFRKLADEELLDACLDEIATTCVASHDKEPAIKGQINGDYSEKVKDIINEEIQKVLDYFQMEERGQEYFREYLTTGELAFENVFSFQKPELGILDVKCIMPENIDPVYRNWYNREIDFFNYRKPKTLSQNHPYSNQNQQVQTFDSIPLSRSQLTYVNCNKFHFSAYGNNISASNTNPYQIEPYIMKGFKSNMKLNLAEDGLVRNFINHGADKYKYTFPTGNMDGPTKAAYLRQNAQMIKRKKVIGQGGNVYETYDPNSFNEDIFLTVDENGVGPTVDRMAASGSIANLSENLNYYRERVYEKMRIPVTRLNPDVNATDGTAITQQELNFGERCISMQKKLASAIKRTVITHLKLKGLKFQQHLHTESCKNKLITEGYVGEPELIDEQVFQSKYLDLIEEDYFSKVLVPLIAVELGCSDEEAKKENMQLSYWDQYDLKEKDIDIELSLPTNFLAIKQQQSDEIKNNNFVNKLATGVFSKYMLAKETYGWSDADIKKHREWQKKEAEEAWELSQITEVGPDFREVAAAEAGVDIGGASALPTTPSAGGGTGGGNDVAEFGDTGALDDIGEVPDSGGDVPDDLPEPDTEEPAPTPEVDVDAGSELDDEEV